MVASTRHCGEMRRLFALAGVGVIPWIPASPPAPRVPPLAPPCRAAELQIHPADPRGAVFDNGATGWLTGALVFRNEGRLCSLVGQPRVRLFMYQVSPNGALRNNDLPTRAANGNLMKRPTTALDLHYLLGRPQVEAMVEQVTGGKVLPAEVLQQIVTKTDGVPLFVEELTKMVVESGLLREADGHYELTGPLPPLAIPSTLQGV